MSRTLLQTYGLKFHPFRPDVPIEALQVTPTLDAFLRRVELSIADGGYVMITGEPGTGKSVALRLLKKRLDDISDVVVGIIEQHGGRIEVESAPGKGTRFAVHLPLRPPAQSAQPAATPSTT